MAGTFLIQGNKNICRATGAKHAFIRNPYLKPIVASPDARLKHLMGKNIQPLSGKSLSQQLTDGLQALSGLTAYGDREIYLTQKTSPLAPN